MKYEGECIKNTLNECNSVHVSFYWEKKNILPCCYQWWLIEYTKQWMLVINYSGECIRNMEWVKLECFYCSGNVIKPNIKIIDLSDTLWICVQIFFNIKTYVLTLMLLLTFDWVDLMMNESN